MSLRNLLNGTFATALFISGNQAAHAAAPAPDASHATPPRKPAASTARTRPQPHPGAQAAPLHPAAELLNVSVRRAHAYGTTETVSAEMLANAVPGTNPQKILATLPGVMFQSDDPQGLDTWSTQFYMHGFLQNQIGMTLDGIPLGDQEFRSLNGLNTTAAISSENIGHVDVSASAGAESVASTSNLGGSLEYYSADPDHKRRLTTAQTFGSNAAFHTFLRADSGDLNPTGTRFYLSYMRNDTGKWKGGGNQFAQQVNAKFLQPIGNDSKISALFDWSDKDLYNYQDMSFDMLRNGGYNLDNFVGTANGYANAYHLSQSLNGLPGGRIPAAYSRLSDPWDASYYDAITAERDYLGGLNFDFALSRRLRWKSTVYGNGQYRRGGWTTPYAQSPNGAPLAEQINASHTQRYGFTSSLTYTVARNELSAGIWYENFHTQIGRYGIAEPLLGQGNPVNTLGSLPDGYQSFWFQSFNSNSFTGFAQDTYHPLPNLALHFGFRSLLQTVRAGQDANDESYTGTTGIAAGSMTTARAFLPHISADWHFLNHHELFFDVSENVKSYPVAAYKQGASPFAVTQSQFNQIRDTLKPETDWNYAVGYRYTDRIVSASLYAYHTDFHNRLQQTTSGTIINPVSTVTNVGSVTMNGIDAGLTIHPTTGLSLYNSISYDHATYGDNLTEAGVLYHTRGQQVVNYPRFMYKASLSYSHGPLDMHVDTQYLGTRNFSYVGDMKAPGYWMENLGLRYRAGDMGSHARPLAFLKNLTFSFDIYNLAGTRYIATMGENGNPVSGDYQSFLVGAPRQFFGTVRADF
ncbi:TonB-dependent receptor domain-containing protein [Gluconacetobacter takamatsuzukensis]|uniref:TonB-dependent receptor n=1 Tax=Gluconacetobacter takamatsuzukensis TaxID=1286190 RepID=A0A7W4PRV8_9PROT|nr:TonB-dependent receptor [Gluconacetobacter takamatsuzukensis]MBB2205794.1 TonB-dependent receptor [Gluconacetobacter takamatsuzukensis]